MRLRRCASSLPTDRARMPSAIVSPTVIRGSSDAYGSWKIICTVRRTVAASNAVPVSTGSPASVTRPDTLAPAPASPKSALPNVVLPEPDSPTNASVSPSESVNDTFFTAGIPSGVRQKPRRRSYVTERRSTVSTQELCPAAADVDAADGVSTADRPTQRTACSFSFCHGGT